MSDKPNPECLVCPAETKARCKEIIKGWRTFTARKPAFIRDIVRMAMKDGTRMKCLSWEEP